jgi:hypothetical protein
MIVAVSEISSCCGRVHKLAVGGCTGVLVIVVRTCCIVSDFPGRRLSMRTDVVSDTAKGGVRGSHMLR